MAGCDNIYGNREQWNEFRDFLYKNNQEYITDYMYEEPLEEFAEERRICYTAEIQEFLLEECPLQWVKDQLIDNCNIQTLICGKPHHEKWGDEKK